MASLLDDYQGGILGVDTTKGSKIPPTRKEKLQAELKILEWHKMANNAAIKSALLQTKSLKVSQPQKPAAQHSEDDAKWIKKVIQQEHIKPLEVSKDFVIGYEEREKEQQDRLSNQVERHIQTLKSLRQKLEARHDMKQRNEEYRQWQKEFLPKKQAVMIGKTLEEVELAKLKESGPSEEERLDAEINDDVLRRAAQRNTNKGKGPHQTSQELTTVLDSLGRLAELEQRISSLEKDNRYDTLMAKENPPAFQRSSIEFNEHKMYPELSHSKVNGNTMHGVNPEIRKKRAQTDKNGPMGVVYEVRTKNAMAGGDPLLRGNANNRNNKSWKVKVPMAGSGAAAVRGKRQGQGAVQYDTDGNGGDDYDDDNSFGGGKGVFITAGQTSEENLLQRQRQQQREAAKREKARSNYLAPAGVQSLKGRRQQRKGREKEVALGQQKHAQAMMEMQRRKQQQQQLSKGINAAARNAQRGGPVTKGAAAGVRTKNKHLQQFQMEKQQHQKRKGEAAI
jgi:hypothetical protein